MSEMTWDVVEAEFWRLYRNKSYAEALDLVTRHEALFPEREQFYNWRMCMAARTGDIPLALQMLEQTLDDGLWYSTAALREDADLETLQGLPEFERLAAISEARFREAAAQAKPELLTIAPESGTPPYPLLLALHGNHSNSAESARFWRPAAARGWLLALPQSSQMNDPNGFVWNDRERGAGEIRRHYETLLAQHAINRERVVVAGFSMGGGLATWLAASDDLGARGFIAVGPYLADVKELEPLLDAPAKQPLRGYIIVGDQDYECYQVAQDLAALLKTRGIACELEVHPNLGHAFPPGFERSLLRALDFVLAD